MMKYLLLFIFVSHAFSKTSDSFIVEIGDQNMVVTSPAEKKDNVSIIVINNTLDKIVSELKTDKKVLKRFVLTPNGKEVSSVNMKSTDTLYFVPLAPPFEAAKLEFNKKTYEIPAKK